MFTPPSLPTWDALHPLVVHFPIALLLVAPLFVVLGILVAERARCLFLAALILMALGTAGSYVAVATGEEAARRVARTDEIASVLTRHEEAAEATRLAFTALTLAFLAGFVATAFWKPKRPVAALLLLLFLALYAGGALLLANTGHLGGRLVHEFGVGGPGAPGAPDHGRRGGEGPED